MGFYDAIRVGASGASADYEVDRSLRFNNDDSAYLNRTLGTATDRNRFTFSFWVKRSNLGTSQRLLVASDGSASTDEDYGTFFFTSSDQLKFSGNISDWRLTTQKFRDISSWYHIVLSVDTDQSTASNRIKIYVNGSEITSFSTNNNPSSGTNLAFNHSYAHYIGRLDTSSDHFDGYMAEINFVDGLQLTPSSFGETNLVTGQWIPKKYTGSYGTNGFYLNFLDNSGTTATTLGKDSSGNGNNFTPNNFSVAAGTGNDSLEDTPTNNFATFNNLVKNANTFSEGNLQATMTSSTPAAFYSTMGVSSGKYYMEFLVKSNNNYPLGISSTTRQADYFSGSTSDQIGFWLQSTNTRVFRNGSNITANSEVVGNFETGVEGTSTTWAVDDIAGLALDMDNKIIYLYKGATQVGYVNFSTFNYDTVFFGGGNYINGNVYIGNFGQRTFAHTPPTGYKSLCSANLPNPTIKLPNKHFGTILYTGNDSDDRNITDSSAIDFTPDWVWHKARNATNGHFLFDSVRGATKFLATTSTTDEYTQTDSLSAFITNGFTVSDNTAQADMNSSSHTYVTWNWNAGGSTVTNNDGDISSQVRANTSAGISIGTYTGSGTSGDTIGTGLVDTSIVFLKNRTSSSTDWVAYHDIVDGSYDYFYLNQNVANSSSSLTHTLTNVFKVGSNASVNTNKSGDNYVFYAWSQVKDFSSFGNYTGNGSTDGTFIHTGFRPSFVMLKKRSGAGSWFMYDNKRNPSNAAILSLYANLTNVDGTPTSSNIDILSNGFKIRGTHSSINASSATYVYFAFAESPFRNARAR
tara:strand:+ start:267 stop:2678 length:2412 start_codon:yes stop_codon:yes gene_type:complete